MSSSGSYCTISTVSSQIIPAQIQNVSPPGSPRLDHLPPFPRFKPPPRPDSILPQSREEFILRLSDKEKEQLVKPVRSGSLGADTVYSVRDTQTDMVLMVTAGDVVEIIERHREAERQTHQQCDDTVDIEASETINEENNEIADGKRRNNWRLVLILITTSTIILLFAAILTTTLIVKSNKSTAHETTNMESSNISNSVIIVGGGDGATLEHYSNAVQIYDPSHPKDIAVLNVTLKFGVMAASVASYERWIFVAGGYLRSSSFGFSEQSVLQAWDIETQSFELAPNMQQARSEASATILHGSLIVCGGVYHNVPLESCELFNISSWQWQPMAQMLHPRAAFGLQTVRNSVYAFGGRSSQGLVTRMEKYQASVWTDIDAQPLYATSGLSSCVLNSHIVTCGGQNGDTITNRCQLFNSTSQIWVSFPDMIRPRLFAGLVNFDGKLFMLGGGSGSYNPDNSVEFIDFNQPSAQWQNALHPLPLKRWAPAIIKI